MRGGLLTSGWLAGWLVTWQEAAEGMLAVAGGLGDVVVAMVVVCACAGPAADVAGGR